MDSRSLETYHFHRNILKIKLIDSLECMVCTAVENSYVFAAWRAVLLIKERNGIQLKRKQQGPLNKAFDTVLQEKACAVMCLCKISWNLKKESMFIALALRFLTIAWPKVQLLWLLSCSSALVMHYKCKCLCTISFACVCIIKIGLWNTYTMSLDLKEKEI